MTESSNPRTAHVGTPSGRVGADGQPVLAQVHCMLLQGGIGARDLKSGGFYDSRDAMAHASARQPSASCTIDITAKDQFTVGRHPDNRVRIDNIWVSRFHFRIYSILWEELDPDKQQPMLYVQDRSSLSGIFVNGEHIGSRDNHLSSTYLLDEDDVIKIEPYWEFRVQLFLDRSYHTPLTMIQSLEAKLFADKYVISERIIGCGAYSNVFLAQDVQSGKQLACKVCNLDSVHSRQRLDIDYMVRQLAKEPEIVGKVSNQHPNLVALEAAYRSKHTVYTITELATGGDLFSLLADHGPLSESQAKLVMHQILMGIAYLHQRGLAHRDLKPENILLARFGVRSRIMISDLQSVKATTWGRLMSHVGTESFMAPEIFAGEYTEAVDIWSIGVIFLCLFMPGCPHFSALKTMDQGEIDACLQTVCGELSRNHIVGTEYLDLVRSCIQKDPTRRLTAIQALNHQWFRVAEYQSKKWEKIRYASFKPTHRVAPPVIELAEVAAVSSPAGSRSLLLWKGHLSETEEHVKQQNENSPYFALALHKAQEQVGMNKVTST